MKITNPELEVVRFSADDVIATSLYYIKDGDVYKEFEGVMTPDSNGRYKITPVSGFTVVDDDDVEGLMSGGSVVFFGTTIDMSDLAPIAQQTYTAFKIDDEYYTYGVTYYEQYWNKQ